jgi:hypothetical protein
LPQSPELEAADPGGRTEREVHRWGRVEVSCRLAYFIAKTAHPGSNRLLDNHQGVKPVEREFAMRNAEGHWERNKPPVVPRAPSFWAIGIQRCVLSVRGQGGTATPVVQLLDHEPIPLVESQREGMRCELSGRAISHELLWNSLLTDAFNLAMDQTLARRTLQELIKREDLKNKSCVDCGNPNPQWASLRFSPFILSRHFPKSILSASPYLSACNARGFIEVSACTSGELFYVIVIGLF